jgi:hypothetical protein
MLRYLITAVLIVLICYGLVEAWPLVAGPSLSIASPVQNGAYPGGIVAVRGVAARAATLTLNGAPLLHDQNGSFSSTLTFPRGGTILTFVATDRFGKTITQTRTIFVP